jgi:hypothetical protein
MAMEYKLNPSKDDFMAEVMELLGEKWLINCLLEKIITYPITVLV